MVSKIYRFCLVAFALVGCAQPKYERVVPLVQKGGTCETKAECAVTFQSSGYCLSWAWEKAPAAVMEPGSLIFKVHRLNSFDQSAVMVESETLPEVVLWMPGMNHGSTATEVQRLDTGTYRASLVVFVMRGEWETKFQFKNGTEVRDEARASVVF